MKDISASQPCSSISPSPDSKGGAFMTDGRRVLLAGFKGTEIDAIASEGLDVRVCIQMPERGEKLEAGPREVFDYQAVAKCDFETVRYVSMPTTLRRELYRRAFSLYRRHHHRMTFARNKNLRSWTHLDNLFHIAANFYLDVLERNKITSVVFSNFPHEGSLVILYALAQILKLETVVCTQAPFPGKMWLVRELKDFGPFETVSGEGKCIDMPIAPETPFYMKRVGRFERAMDMGARVVLEFFKMTLKLLSLKFFFDKPSIDRNMNRLIDALDRFRLGNPSPQDLCRVNLDDTFVYFPLHLQPEMTTDTWGGAYGDQLLAIEELAAALPPGVQVFVKENPKQTRFMREESFFRRLRAIPNVRYVSFLVPTFELIRRSRCVATISGTAGWEALLLGKSALIFGTAWYSSLPGVFVWSGPESLKQALEFQSDRDELSNAFQKLSRKLYSGLVDPNYSHLIPNYDRATMAKVTAGSIASVLSNKAA